MEINSKQPIESFFDLSVEKRAKCLVVDCKSNLRSQKPSTLLRHFTQVHQSKLKEINISKEKNLAWLRLSTIYLCVKHVTTSGRPLISIYDDSFQELLKERLEKLKGTPHELNINLPLLKKFINESANKLRQRILKELEDKTVSLMLDIATRQNRSIFGISSQIILDGDIVIRTLGMERIKVKHTSQNLKTIVTDVGKRFGIKEKDVISITHDNGANVVALPEKIDTFVLENISDDSDDDTLDQDLFFDPEIQADLLKRAAEEINSSFNPVNFSYTNSVRCGCHTSQLSVNLVLNGPECAGIFKKALDLVKELRIPRFRHQLEAQNVPIPRKDNQTRWFSKYMMVNRMKSLA